MEDNEKIRRLTIALKILANVAEIGQTYSAYVLDATGARHKWKFILNNMFNACKGFLSSMDMELKQRQKIYDAYWELEVMEQNDELTKIIEAFIVSPPSKRSELIEFVNERFYNDVKKDG